MRLARAVLEAVRRLRQDEELREAMRSPVQPWTAPLYPPPTGGWERDDEHSRGAVE